MIRLTNARTLLSSMMRRSGVVVGVFLVFGVASANSQGTFADRPISWEFGIDQPVLGPAAADMPFSSTKITSKRIVTRVFREALPCRGPLG